MHVPNSVLLITPQAAENWNPITGDRRQRYTHPNGYQFSCCGYNPFNQTIALGVYTGEILLIEAVTFSVLKTIEPEVCRAG